MTRSGGFSSRITPWAALLMALALVVRIAVPVGFMPAAGALAICGGQLAAGTAKTMAMAMPGHARGHDDRDGTERGNCAFAAMAGALDLASPPPPVVAPLSLLVPMAGPIPVAWPGLGLAAPPPPKTGPPALR